MAFFTSERGGRSGACIPQADGAQRPEGSEEKAAGVRIQLSGGPHHGGQMGLPVLLQLLQGGDVGGGQDVVEGIHEPFSLLLADPVHPVVQGPVPVLGVSGQIFHPEEVGPIHRPGEGVVLEKAVLSALDHLAGLVLVQQQAHH